MAYIRMYFFYFFTLRGVAEFMALVGQLEVCDEKGNKMKTIEQQGPFV